MLDQIRDFFREHMLPSEAAVDTETELRRAAVALLLEMTHMDDEVGPAERDAVARLVRECFGVDAAAADELLACAEAERRDSTDYFQFTSLINNHFDGERKAKLVEALWRVAYADERLSKYEEFLVRKLSDLLYVPHAVFIAAKHRVAAEHGIDDEAAV